MKVSVIIPTFNEEKYLESCLVSLSKQSIRDFEVIVIDDGSTDKTFETISKLNFQNFKLQILKQNHLGAGAARNLGGSIAKGEILVFVDADMTFEKHFLKNLIKPIILDRVKGTFSKDELVSNWENVWARCWNIQEGWDKKKRHPKNYPDHQKVFRAVLKSEFDSVNGFTPGGYTDDHSLGEKLGYDAVNSPKAIFYHKNPSSIYEVFKHAQWVGKRDYKFGKLGIFVALIRSSFPISLLVGIVKSILNREPRFVIFKIYYDLGLFLGIVRHTFGKNPAK